MYPKSSIVRGFSIINHPSWGICSIHQYPHFRKPRFSLGFPIFPLAFPGPLEELVSNVLLAGGGSLLRGLPERLQKDLAAVLPESRVEVVAPDTRLGMSCGKLLELRGGYSLLNVCY